MLEQIHGLPLLIVWLFANNLDTRQLVNLYKHILNALIFFKFYYLLMLMPFENFSH